MRANCLLCNEETSRIIHSRLGEYHSCPKCEFISKNRQYHLSEEEEVTLYNHHQNSIDDPRYVEFFKKFLEDAVFPYTKRPVQGLDFGSGPSPVLAQILERFHGYEMDIYDLYYSPKKIYERKSYDLITTTEVVEHLRNPLADFELFAKLLKPDGVLAVMTLFHPKNEQEFLNWHYIRDPSHISFYRLKTMEYIASRTGLKVIHSNNIRYTTFALDK